MGSVWSQLNPWQHWANETEMAQSVYQIFAESVVEAVKTVSQCQCEILYHMINMMAIIFVVFSNLCVCYYNGMLMELTALEICL